MNSRAIGKDDIITVARVPFPWRVLVWVATFLSLALLAAVVAWWGWRTIAPPSEKSASAIARDSPAAALILAPPFGSAARAAPATAPAASTGGVVLSGQTRLLGVLAGSDGDGQALFRLADRGAVLVRTGQDVTPEVKLERVTPDGVRLRDHGEVRDILLRAASPLVVAAAKPPPGKSSCAQPAGYVGASYRLNAELLEGIAGRAQGWASMLSPGERGLVVNDATGLAALIGMRAGDRIMQANGIALTTLSDMETAVVRPLVANQAVRLSGSRDGKPQEWLLLNAGAC